MAHRLWVGGKQNFEHNKVQGVDREYAILSKESYNQNRQDVEGYSYDKEMSTKNAAVYHKNGKPIIAYRGTAEVEDLASDVQIATGQTGKRFRDSEEIADRVHKKYKTAPTLTGHSLGGSLASHVGQKRGNNVVIFNPGSNLLLKQRNNPNIIVHRSKGDLISGGYAKFGGEGSLLGTVKTHSISSFL